MYRNTKNEVNIFTCSIPTTYLTKQLHFELPQFNRNQFLDLSLSVSFFHCILLFFHFAIFNKVCFFSLNWTIQILAQCFFRRDLHENDIYVLRVWVFFFCIAFTFRLAWIIHKMYVVGTFQDVIFCLLRYKRSTVRKILILKSMYLQYFVFNSLCKWSQIFPRKFLKHRNQCTLCGCVCVCSVHDFPDSKSFFFRKEKRTNKSQAFYRFCKNFVLFFNVHFCNI